LLINDKLISYKWVNQSDFSKRGHNVYLFDMNFKKSDKIVIILLNGDKTGGYVSSDALLFIKK